MKVPIKSSSDQVEDRDGIRRGVAVSLRLRLALIYGALASVALSLALVAGYGFYERAAFRNLDMSLSLVLRMAQPALDRNGRLEPPQIGGKLALREFDAQGGLRRSSGAPDELGLDPVVALSLGMPAHADWIGVLPYVSYGVTNYAGLGLTVVGGGRWRSLTVRLADRRIAQVLFPLAQIDDSLASVRLKFWALGLAGAAIVFALGYGLSGPSLRPLTRLARAAEGVVHDPRRLLGSKGFDPDLSPLEDALKLVFERLSQRERFVSGILGATPSLVYVYDFELDANTYSNDQLGPLLGYTQDQVRGFDGRFLSRLVHPENRDLTRAHLNGVRDSQNGTVLENEYRVRHADGSWRWFRSRDVVFERGLNGQIKSILGVADDVTERRQIEANTQFLVDLDSAIRLLHGPLEIETGVTRALGEHLDAIRCLILRVEGETVKIEREWIDGVPSSLGEHALGGYFLPDAILEYTAGRVIVIENSQTHPGSRDRIEELLALGHASSVVAPLFGVGGWRGLLAVYRDKPSFWRSDEIQLVRDVAARVWPELERARAVAALEVSRAQLDAALESSETAIWEFDRVNDEIAYSGAYGPFHGLPSGAGRVAAAHIRTLTLPEDDKRNRPAFEWALESGEMFEAEYRLRVADLPERWVLSRGRVQTVGGYPMVAGTLTDITERKRSEKLLRQSEARYRALVQSTTQFIWRRSSDTEDPESVAWWCHLTGHSPEQASGQGWLEALHPDDREGAGRAWTEAFTNGSLFATDYRVRSRNGKYVHLEVRGVPIPEADGTVIEWVGSFNDVTAERQAVERLHEINAAQQRFVSDASHELRAPLTSIQGNLDVVMRYPNMSPEDRSESLTDAISETKRMARLVQNLLAVARGEAEGAQHETVQLDSVLASAWRVAQTLSETRNFELGSLEPALVEGDRDQIKQLALILLENAIKYTPDGGTVRLEAQVTDGQAEFCVSDSGGGIAAEDLPHVFERFYRADRARTPDSDPGGTGLGLTIAKRIAENHGGGIRLESAIGIGTTFWVRLRLSTNDA